MAQWGKLQIVLPASRAGVPVGLLDVLLPMQLSADGKMTAASGQGTWAPPAHVCDPGGAHGSGFSLALDIREVNQWMAYLSVALSYMSH